MDEYSRDCLAIDVSGSIRSGRVIEVLASALLRWLAKANIETALYAHRNAFDTH